MGWSGGSRLFSEVIEALVEEVPSHADRKNIYLKLIPAFEEEDWDTQDECLDEDDAYEEALYELHPAWKETFQAWKESEEGEDGFFQDDEE